MSNERNIAENLRKLIGATGFDSMLCTVVSVDNDVTCTVKSVKSDVEYKNIKLNANIKDDKGAYIYPKKGSYVLVTMIDKVQGFVSMYSDIEKITLKVDGNIEINGGNNDGLVIIQKLTDKLNGLKDTVNSFINAYNAHIHTTTATIGVGLVGAISPTTSQANAAQPFNKNDYENENITH